MKLVFLTLILSLFVNATWAACTPHRKVEKLWPRSEGWVHIKLEGVSNMDIMNCGNSGETGLLLNFNGNYGTLEGKKMMYSTILAAFMAGKKLTICANACDSQFPSYSQIYAIDNLQ